MVIVLSTFYYSDLRAIRFKCAPATSLSKLNIRMTDMCVDLILSGLKVLAIIDFGNHNHTGSKVTEKRVQFIKNIKHY